MHSHLHSPAYNDIMLATVLSSLALSLDLLCASLLRPWEMHHRNDEEGVAKHF